MPDTYSDTVGRVQRVRLGPTYWAMVFIRRPLTLWMPGMWNKCFDDCTMPDPEDGSMAAR